MTIAIQDTYTAPTDYEDLYRKYYPWLRQLVISRGIPADRSDDVTMEILLKFMEKDVLSDFKPENVYEYKGEKRKSRFKTFIGQFFILYVMQYRTKHYRDTARNTYLDPEWDIPSKIDDIASLDIWSVSIRDLLLEKLSATCKETFEVIVMLLEDDSKVNGVTLNEIFEFKSSTMYKRLRNLRVEVTKILEEADAL